MPQDAFTLKFLCQELNKLFSGGKVNRIIQPDNDELIFTVYTGKKTEKLLLSVNPSAPRIGVSSTDKESPLTAPNFCMLMRKHLLSSTIDKISLIGFDRIVRIDFTASAEFSDPVKKVVFVELMGRYSNIILTENGKILGGNRGINMFDNGVRPLIVGYPYVFPPVGDKKTPDDKLLIDYFDAFAGGSFTDYVCKGVQGLATSTAEQIKISYLNNGYQIGGEGFGVRFFEYINHYISNIEKRPCVSVVDGTVKDVFVFPYEPLLGERIDFESLYLAEEFYYSERDKLKKYTSKKERLSALINTAIKKSKKRLVAITSKEKDALSAEENRIKGELILSNIYRIKHGDKYVELDNYYDGTVIKIQLDERLSPSKNAEVYYKKYNKQKRTILALEPQKLQAQKELDYLLTILDEITLCETLEELMLVGAELQQAGILKQEQQGSKKKQVETHFNVYEIDGFAVKVGRNNLENDKVTFTAKSHDIWLHAKDYHSTHVIIETLGKTPPDQTIKVCAEICGYYSKGRDGGKIEIAYTEKKNVKKPSGAKPGFCTYDNYRTIVVNPEKHAEKLKRLI